MEDCALSSLLGGGRSTTLVVEKSPPHLEIVPLKIPMGIVEQVLNNRYIGDVSLHPGFHLLRITEYCSLFKLAGVEDVVMRKLFSLSLEDKALEWYQLLDNSHLLSWKELESLFYSRFYPLHVIHQDKNSIYNFWPRAGENIAKLGGD